VKDTVTTGDSFAQDKVLVVDDSRVSEDPDEGAETVKKAKIQSPAIRAVPKRSQWQRFINKSTFSSSRQAKSNPSPKPGQDRDVDGIVIHREIIEGAIDRGGRRALEQITVAIKNTANNFIISVDGSRGPRHKMKAGAVILAQRAQVPLYLLRASYPGIPIIFSWDKHRIPYPFSAVTFHISEAIRIGPDMDKNQINRRISECENLLENLVNQ
jgi:hypothetical protein